MKFNFKNQDPANQIEITIFYDQALEVITGKRKEVALISQGMPFLFFLKAIFKSYSEIEKEYPPGTLSLLVNRKPPKEFDILKNGDMIDFSVWRNEAVKPR